MRTDMAPETVIFKQLAWVTDREDFIDTKSTIFKTVQLLVMFYRLLLHDPTHDFK
jgi:hypothetical protein